MTRATKIVATLGPASSSPEILRAMIQAGVDVVRLNFSHGVAQDHRDRANLIRQISLELGREIAIMADLQGPKIRVGKFESGKVQLVTGAKFILDAECQIGNHERAGLDYKDLPKDAADFTLARLNRLEGRKGEYAQDVANDMRAAMQKHAAVFRTQASMDEGVQKIAEIRERVNAIALTDTSKVFNTARIEALEVENLIECAQATMVSAAARRECRGAHTVSDYERPADDPIAPLGRDDANWMKHTLWHSDSNSLTYKPVNLKPLTVDSVPPKVRTF